MKGRQSAALMVYRVGDHPEPVAELQRILEPAKEEYLVV